MMKGIMENPQLTAYSMEKNERFPPKLWMKTSLFTLATEEKKPLLASDHANFITTVEA